MRLIVECEHGRLEAHPKSVDFRQAGAIEYRMVDGDPANLEVVE